MNDVEQNARSRIESTETVDVASEDLIEGLATSMWSAPDFPSKMFVLTGDGAHKHAELVGRDGQGSGVLIPPMSFIGDDGRPADRITRVFMIGEGDTRLDAEVIVA